MKKIKFYFNNIFIEGLNGMALGLFSTLIIGTIIQQIGTLIGGDIGNIIFLVGKIASSLTCAGIGIGVAYKFKSSTLVTVSASISAMIGGFANNILSNSIISDTSAIILSGPGEPLGAFIAAFISIKIGNTISNKTKLDIIITPLLSISIGSLIGLIIGPPISNFMISIGNLIVFATNHEPFLMGILVSVIMGILLTLPISSAAIGIILNLNGLAAGAATVGCCCHMVGFAVASFKENKLQGLIAQGVGTSMLQVSNIIKKPIVILPAVLSSAILGPVSTTIFKMTNNSTGSGMGSAGFVGQLMTYETMSTTINSTTTILLILLMHFILPAILSYSISNFMRKKDIIKFGDLALDL